MGFKENKRLTTPLFLFFLGVAGGITSNGIMNCSLKRNLEDNALVQNLVVFIVLYFTSSFTSESKPPLDVLLKTVQLYAILILLIKSEKWCAITALVLMLVILVIEDEIEYREEEAIDMSSADTQNVSLKNTASYIEYTILGLLVIGISLYYLKQREDKGDDFSHFAFVFGNTKCSNKKGKKIREIVSSKLK